MIVGNAIKQIGGFFSKITVTMLGGETFVATSQVSGKTYVAQSPGYGIGATFKVKEAGDYVITNSRNSQKAYATVVDKTAVVAIYKWQQWDSREYSFLTSHLVHGTIYIKPTSSASFDIVKTNVDYLTVDRYYDSSRAAYYLSPEMHGGNFQTVGSPSSPVLVGKPGKFNSSFMSRTNQNLTDMAFKDTSASGCIYVQNNIMFTDGTSVELWSRSQSYEKGDTYYGQVTSQSYTAYPEGRSGNYWYVSV